MELRKPTVYLARTNTISLGLLQEGIDALKVLLPELTPIYHKESDGYDRKLEDNADFLVVLVDTNRSNWGIIGKGVYGQVKQAEKEGKNVYILYKRKTDSSWQLYTISKIIETNRTSFTNRADMVLGVNVTQALKEQVYNNYFHVSGNAVTEEPRCSLDVWIDTQIDEQINRRGKTKQKLNLTKEEKVIVEMTTDDPYLGLLPRV